MPPDLLAQFPIAEEAIEALGLVLWPMVEFEADDAIAAAAGRFAADPAVERILICTPDKDMAQLVEDERIVLRDRRRGDHLRRRRRPGEVGRRAGLHPRLAGARRRRRRRLSGHPGLGREVRRRGPRRLRLDRRHPGAGLDLGGARRRRRPGDVARGVAPRPPRRGAPLPLAGPAAVRRGRGRDPPADAPTSSSGGARRGPAGRRSATAGASTGSGRRPHRWLAEPPRAM